MIDPISPDPAPIGDNAPQTTDDVQNAKMSLLSYRSYISSTSLDSQETLKKIAAAAPKLHDNYYLALQQLMSQIQQLAQLQNKYTAQWKAIRDQQIALNGAIANYNTSVSSAVTQFNSNTAVTNYRQATQVYLAAKTQLGSGAMTSATFYGAGGPQATFDKASSSYNLAVAQYTGDLATAQKNYQAVATKYNQLVAATNISTINTQLAPQSLPTPPSAPSPSLSLTGGTSLPASPSSFSPYTAPVQGTSYGATSDMGLIKSLPTSVPLITAITVAGQPPTTSAGLEAAGAKLLEDFNEAIDLVTFSQNLYLESIHEDNQIGNIALPRAYISRSPALFTQGSPTLTGDQTAVGAGALMTQLSAGLSNKNLLKILSSDIYSSICRKLDFPLSDLEIGLRTFASGLIAQAAKEAGAPTADQLYNHSGAKVSSLVSDLGGAVAFAENIRKEIKSGLVEENIANLVNGSPSAANLSATDKQNLIDSLSAAFKLGLLNAALSQVALSAGLPELSRQLLANVSGVSVGSTKPSEADNISDTLDDPLSVLFLEQALADLISSFQIESPFAGEESSTQAPAEAQPATPAAGAAPSVPAEIPRERAESIVHKAIQTVLAGPELKNRQELQTALTAAFIDQGLKKDVAEKIAKDAATLIIAESQVPGLNTKINPNNFGALATLITPSPPTPPPAPLPVEAPVSTSRLVSMADAVRSRILQEKLLGEIKQNAVVGDVLKQELAGKFETVHEFRNSLIEALLAEGISAQDAARVGNLAAQILLDVPTKGPDSIIATQTSRLELKNLAEEWSSYLSKMLSPKVDSYRARKLIDNSIHTLIGEDSILHQYNEQIRILREKAHDDAIAEFNRAAPTLTRASLPLFAFRQQVSEIVRAEITAYMDPARDSLMAGTGKPSNFKRSIDIPI